MLRSLRLDFTWDEGRSPSFSVPLADFFGVGLGRMTRFHSLLTSNPEGRSLNCFIPMPFRSGMKIALANESPRDLAAFYYDIDYTLGDHHGDDTLYFHACYRRENPTTQGRDYEILPLVKGRGRFLGSTMGVIVNRSMYARSWWGEGEVKVHIDGDGPFPTLCGTGTEDYIGTAWGLGRYAGLEQGCPLAEHSAGQYWFYRHHVSDPVYFSRDIRVTIQQIGFLGPEPFAEENAKYYRERGTTIRLAGTAEGTLGRPRAEGSQPEARTNPYVIFEREDDWSSCAWLYLDTPTSTLPALPPAEQRTAGLLQVSEDSRCEMDLGFCTFSAGQSTAGGEAGDERD
jgi:hypothetical protein